MPVSYAASVDVKNHNMVLVNHNEGNETYLSLSTEELIELLKDYTFCTSVLKMINEKKVSSPPRYLQMIRNSYIWL